jgi:hypothetical protein
MRIMRCRGCLGVEFVDVAEAQTKMGHMVMWKGWNTYRMTLSLQMTESVP